MLKLKHIIKDVVEKHQTNESGILYRAGVKKYGKEGMRKIQQAAGKRKSHAVIGAIKDKYEKKKKESVAEAEMVLRRKGGKTVTFTNKDNYEKAKKSGDYESPDKEKASKQDVDSDMYAQDTWDRFGGDTGKDADYGGGDFTKSADYDMWSDEDPEDAGEPDFYDPEDYEKLYPDKTKPKDEVGDIKYGKGFSPDSDHMFDSVAGSASSASDKYSELLDSVKSGNWKQFRSRIHDIYDEDAREHLLNLANHVDSGTYNDEFPKGKKGLEFGRKEVMDLFRQAADYGDEQFGDDDKEESIIINGKQYKRISESINPTVFDPLTEAKKQLGGLYTRMKDK